jgi:hypothetical protein
MFLAGWEEVTAQLSQFATLLRNGGDSVDISSPLFWTPCLTSGFSPRCSSLSLSRQTPQVSITCVYVVIGTQHFTCKGNGHSMICLHSTEGRSRYSSYQFATRYYKKVGGQHHSPAALTPGRRPGSHHTGSWVGLGYCLDGTENTAPTGIPSPDHPVRKTTRYIDYAIPAAVYISHITTITIIIKVVGLGLKSCPM